MKNIGFLALSFISISCFAALKPPHDSTSYNRVIGNVNHEVGRADAIGFDDSSTGSLITSFWRLNAEAI